MDDKVTEILEKQTKLMEQLVANKEESHEKLANFSTYTPLHGSGGIFAVPGLERDIITTHMRPSGITSILPRIPTVYQDPRFGSLTGYTAPTGSQPTHACEDAPKGYVKGCNLTARFGRIRFDTNTIDIDDVALRLHRGDFTDLMLRGKVLGLTGLTPGGMNEGEILNLVTMSEMVIAAVNMERELNRQTWQGVTTVANEFPGLDVQIATGQRDADTNAACTALDSDVKNFGYDLVCGSNRSIVDYLSSMMWYLNDIADGTGVTPVQWVLAMRKGLWHELSACWPCQYNTYRCSPWEPSVAGNGISGNAGMVDASDMVAVRDAMRQGMYIDIEGVRYPVITDTGIRELTPADNANILPGEYASSIYAIPMSITGGWQTTYMEYLDFRQAAQDVALLHGMQNFWTDTGFYSWAYNDLRWCFDLALKVEPRVILRTPQLAGRIDAIKYSPLQHGRDTDPSSSYFADGGASLRNNQVVAPYSVWSSRQ
jgi:hypothetical protein